MIDLVYRFFTDLGLVHTFTTNAYAPCNVCRARGNANAIREKK